MSEAKQINTVTTCGIFFSVIFFLSPMLREKLMVTPVHQCSDLLQNKLKFGAYLYLASHSLSVHSRKGKRLLFVAEK